LADFSGGLTVMSTLAVVEEILRETAVPMSVREIVERAGARLPSKSKTPDTVVARDLSMDIKRKGEGSMFIRTSPGRYTLRALVRQSEPAEASALAAGTLNPNRAATPQPLTTGALAARKPAAPAQQASGVERVDRPRGGRSDREAEGGGYAS
jgi:hypothetical protein